MDFGCFSAEGPKENDPAYLKIKVFAFHDVGHKPLLSVSRVGLASFRRMMEFLRKGHMPVRGLSECSKPDDLALTFDDGLESFYAYAFPILENCGFRATVFLVTDYIGRLSTWDYQQRRHLNWGQIAALASAGVEFGSHSATHRDLRQLSDAELRREVFDSRSKIQDRIGQPVNYFCYPFGRYDARVIEMVKEAGYKAAFARTIGRSRYSIPRLGVYAYDTPYSLAAKLNGHWIERLKDWVANYLAGGTIIAQRVCRTLR